MISAPLREHRVLVAILTYRRPDQLRRVLPEVRSQASRLTPAADVVVIDNDPEGSAEDTVAEQRKRQPLGLSYVHEPTPGISAARNAALDASSTYDALVFIDDDEVPGAGWLDALVGHWQRAGASAVTGPVISTFDATHVDAWVLDSNAFATTTAQTGSARRGAATNNLLLDTAFLRTHDLRFDTALGLIGGEDTLLSHQIIAEGGQIHWCEEARVFEPVAEERLNRRWILRRAFRSGASWAHAELEVVRGPARAARWLTLLAKGLVHVVVDAVQWAAARAAGRRSAPRRLVALASHAGMLSRTVARPRLREYARSDG